MEKAFGAKDSSLKRIYHVLATIYQFKNDFNNALKDYEKALNIQEKELGTEHSETADIYDQISQLYRTQHDFDNAMKYAKRALGNH